jgi:hypothetical protein
LDTDEVPLISTEAVLLQNRGEWPSPVIPALKPPVVADGEGS